MRNNTKDKPSFLSWEFIAAFPVFLAWLLFLIPFYRNVTLYRNGKQYTKDIFIVEAGVFYERRNHAKSNNAGPKITRYSYLTGKLGSGSHEKYTFYEFPEYPLSQKQLNDMVPIGERIDVYYNPHMSADLLNGSNLRVVPREYYYSSNSIKSVLIMGVAFGTPFLLWLTFISLWIIKLRKSIIASRTYKPAVRRRNPTR